MGETLTEIYTSKLLNAMEKKISGHIDNDLYKNVQFYSLIVKNIKMMEQ